MARAMDPAAALRHQTLVATATAASRDATTELALETLAGSGFSVPRALARLADGLVRLDALETFSLEEADLFTRGCHKYGKAFRDIHAEFLPWKSLEDIIEFYYLWKTSAHYLQRKRLKQSQTDTSLKQFCITNFNKIDRSNEFSVGSNEDGDSAVGSGSGCRGCGATKSDNWFGLGPPKCIWKVCLSCWNYWRRYGDLKAVSVYDHFGPLTVVYKCPVSNCLEESSDRTCLAVHLNAVHPQLGGAYATQVKPTLATQRTTRKAGASHSTAFTFMSSLHLRLVRRMDSRRACRMRARRPYQPARAQLPKLRSLLVTRLGADPGFISRLAQSVRRVKPVPTVAAAEARLSHILQKIKGSCRSQSPPCSITMSEPSFNGRNVTLNSIKPTRTPLSTSYATSYPNTNNGKDSSMSGPTMMFLANQTTKKKRREVLTPTKKRKLCRCPCSSQPLETDSDAKANEENSNNGKRPP